MGAGPIDNKVGVCAVADKVAQADDLIELTASIFEYRFQRLPIPVNIAHD